MTHERRRTPRYRFDTSIGVDDVQGRSVDVSGSGMFFESPRRYAPGDRVSVVIPLHHDGPGAYVTCDAQVIRVEARGEVFGVAVSYEPVAFNVPT